MSDVQWVMTVVFGDPRTEPNAHEYLIQHGRSEMRALLDHLKERWGDDLEETIGGRPEAYIDSSRTHVYLYQEMIDPFLGIQDWLIMNTSPRSIRLERVEPD